MHDQGLGVIKNRVKGIELYKLAASRGSIKSMFNLGVAYGGGLGVKKDNIESDKWLELSRFYTQNSKNIQINWRVRGALDEISKEMNEQEIQKAKQLASVWSKKQNL